MTCALRGTRSPASGHAREKTKKTHNALLDVSPSSNQASVTCPVRRASSKLLSAGAFSPCGPAEEAQDALRPLELRAEGGWMWGWGGPVDVEPTGAAMEVRGGLIRPKCPSVRHGDSLERAAVIYKEMSSSPR